MSFDSVFSCYRPALSACSAVRAARTARRLPTGLRALFACAAMFASGAVHAQGPGSRDTTFNSSLSGTTVFAVATENVSTGTEVIAGGDTTSLSVLDNVGAIVKGFNFPPFGGADRLVYTIAPEIITNTTFTAPKLLIGGLFGQNSFIKPAGPAQNITRINLLGAIDSSFNPGVGANDIVTSILPQSDGSMFVGGKFTEFDHKPFPRLVRLLGNGSIDPAFQSVPVGDGVFALAAEYDPATGTLDDKIIVGGTFSTIGSGNYTKLARVDQAGNVDQNFKPAIDSRVLAIATQPDGKIVIGGEFNVVNGTPVSHLARLNQDGSLDTTFVGSVSVIPAQTSAPVAVYVLRLLADGRIYVGGNFSAVDGVYRQYLGLINSDGSLYTDFDPGSEITNSVQSVAIQPDNHVLVAETVSKKVNDVFLPSLIRLYGVTPIPTVRLSVTRKRARAGTNASRTNGLVTLTRAGADLDSPLTVYFGVGGTAQSGVAYKPLVASQVSGATFSVTFAADQTSLRLKIKPRDIAFMDAPETVVFTLLPPPSGASLYETTSTTTGTVKIRNPLF